MHYRKGGENVAQYKNVLRWLETEYLHPAVQITKKVAEASSEAEEPSTYTELKEIEELLQKGLEYVRQHQN